MLATAVDGLLAGASLDQSVKQLPVRHRIGVRAFSEYSQASDLHNGIWWYATLGLGGASLTLAAAGGGLMLGVSGKQRLPLLLAGALTIAHSLTTVGRRRSICRSARPRATRRRWRGSSIASNAGKPCASCCMWRLSWP